MPKPEGSLTAVIVSGGKQYRVAPGDRILVDRITAEPGSSVRVGRVLMVHDGDDIKVGVPVVDGVDVEARVLAHRRGPRIETLRYKSKKRVRVHRGGRADLTALEILAIGGMTVATGTETEKATEAPAKGRGARRAKAVPAQAEVAIETKAEAPKRRTAKSKESK